MVEKLFDRKLYRANQVRHAEGFSGHNFLHHQIAEVIAESVEASGSVFGKALEISPKDEFLRQLLLKTGKIGSILGTNYSQGLLSVVRNDAGVICDDECLPFKDRLFDLVCSNLNLQHINIVPQFLLDVKRILRENGFFVASFFGENNLLELKRAVLEAENEVLGQASPRIIPAIDVKTAANLLQKAGFSDVVSSVEAVEVFYSDAMDLLRDLKLMGQGNVLVKRDKKWMTQKFLDAILNKYVKIMGFEGGVRARFEVILLVGRV